MFWIKMDGAYYLVYVFIAGGQQRRLLAVPLQMM